MNLSGSAHVILSAFAGDTAIVDSVDGTVVIASQTAGAPPVVKPLRRSAFDIVDRTDLGTPSAPGTYVLVDRELAVGNHPFVEITADDVRIEAGSGSPFQFNGASLAVPHNLDDML